MARGGEIGQLISGLLDFFFPGISRRGTDIYEPINLPLYRHFKTSCPIAGKVRRLCRSITRCLREFAWFMHFHMRRAVVRINYSRQASVGQQSAHSTDPAKPIRISSDCPNGWVRLSPTVVPPHLSLSCHPHFKHRRECHSADWQLMRLCNAHFAISRLSTTS